MIASGSSYYGVVRLWDKRQTRCLQVRDGWSPAAAELLSWSLAACVSLAEERGAAGLSLG